MFEEENNNQETQETTPETQEASQEQQESTKDYNFRALREEKERLQRERDEYHRMLLENQKIDSKQAPQEEEDDFDLNPDDFVEAKHLKKYAKEMKALKKQIETYQKQSSSSSAEYRVRSKYPDFDKVVSESNVKLLSEEYPEVAATIRSNNDIELQASSAYTLIKKLGIYKEDPYTEDKMKAQQNLSKPKTVNSISQGESPISRANAFASGLTDDLKKQLWAEMNEARKKS